jgi:hypothetical protein
VKFLILQRPPFGEQVLGVYAGPTPTAAFEKAAEQTGIDGRLMAVALSDGIEANVSLTPAVPVPPTVDVELVADIAASPAPADPGVLA